VGVEKRYGEGGGGGRLKGMTRERKRGREGVGMGRKGREQGRRGKEGAMASDKG